MQYSKVFSLCQSLEQLQHLVLSDFKSQFDRATQGLFSKRSILPALRSVTLKSCYGFDDAGLKIFFGSFKKKPTSVKIQANDQLTIFGVLTSIKAFAKNIEKLQFDDLFDSDIAALPAHLQNYLSLFVSLKEAQLCTEAVQGMVLPHIPVTLEYLHLCDTRKLEVGYLLLGLERWGNKRTLPKKLVLRYHTFQEAALRDIRVSLVYFSPPVISIDRFFRLCAVRRASI